MLRGGTPNLRHGDAAVRVAFSSDGKVLASSGLDRTVRLWDPTTGAESTRIEVQDSVPLVALAPAGSRFAATDGPSVRVGDTATGQVTLTIPNEANIRDTLCFSPDGRLLVTWDLAHTLRCRDAATGRERWRVRDRGRDENNRAAFSPDGKLLGSAGHGEQVFLRDPATGKVVRTLALRGGAVTRVAFSPDGKVLAVAGAFAGPGTVLLDVSTGDERRRFEGWSVPVFSPDGKVLAPSEANPAPGKAGGMAPSEDNGMCLWDLAADRELRTLGPGSGYGDAAFSPDGATLARVGRPRDPAVHLWDVAADQERLPSQGHGRAVTRLAFSPDGKLLVSAGADKTLCAWDAAPGWQVQHWQTRVEVETLALAANGRWLASWGGEREPVILWDLGGREPKVFDNLVGRVVALAFAPDSMALAAAINGVEGRRAVLVWFSRPDKQMIRMNRFAADEPLLSDASLAFSADGRSLLYARAAPGRPGRVSVLDLPAGTERFTETVRHMFTHWMVLAPDGRGLASRTGDPAEAWRPPNGPQTLPLEKYLAGARSWAFSPDGKMAAVCSPENPGSISVRAKTSGRELFRLTEPNRSSFRTLAFSPDGQRLATGSADGSVYFWDLVRPDP